MNEKDKKFIAILKPLNGTCIFAIIIGVFGIFLGLWVQFFRPSSPSELMINRSLILFSMGVIGLAYLNIKSFGVIKRLINK